MLCAVLALPNFSRDCYKWQSGCVNNVKKAFTVVITRTMWATISRGLSSRSEQSLVRRCPHSAETFRFGHLFCGIIDIRKGHMSRDTSCGGAGKSGLDLR